MGSLLKRIVKPRTIVGKVAGAVGSVIGIGGGGVVAGLDIVFISIVALAIAAGYLLGWSKEQVKSFISFLNTEQGKRKN